MSGCDTGTLKLGEVRNFRMPTEGLEVAVTTTTSPDELILVRNCIKQDGTSITPAEVLAEWTIDGELAGDQ